MLLFHNMFGMSFIYIRIELFVKVAQQTGTMYMALKRDTTATIQSTWEKFLKTVKFMWVKNTTD